MLYWLAVITIILGQPLLGLADRFYSIFSIHTERVPMCPPNYNPDGEYIGCCWDDYQTVTSAKGPDGKMSPGCCYPLETCTGAPPVMYDWTTNAEGGLVVVNPTASATQAPPNTDSEPTGSDAKPSATGTLPGQRTTADSQQPERTDGAGNSITCNGDQCNIFNGQAGGGPVDQSNSGSSDAKKLSPGEIAGIAIGGVSAVATILGVWFL